MLQTSRNGMGQIDRTQTCRTLFQSGCFLEATSFQCALTCPRDGPACINLVTKLKCFLLIHFSFLRHHASFLPRSPSSSAVPGPCSPCRIPMSFSFLAAPMCFELFGIHTSPFPFPSTPRAPCSLSTTFKNPGTVAVLHGFASGHAHCIFWFGTTS